MNRNPKAIAYIAISVTLLIAALVTLRPLGQSSDIGEFKIDTLAETPVQYNGRLKPINTFAANNLRLIRGRTSVPTDWIEDNDLLPEKLTATQWFMLMNFDAPVADQLPVFRIDHPEVLALIGKTHEDGKYFSWNQIFEYGDKILEEARNAEPESELRTPYEKAVVSLATNLNNYQKLGTSLRLMPGNTDEVLKPYENWQQATRLVIQNIRSQEDLQSGANDAVLQRMQGFIQFFRELAESVAVGISPLGDRPDNTDQIEQHHWNDLGEAMLEPAFVRTGQIDPIAMAYAQASAAWQANDPEAFNTAMERVTGEIDTYYSTADEKSPLARIGFESFFQQLDPFYSAIVLYTLAFMLVSIGWLIHSPTSLRSAQALVIFIFVLHTLAIAARVYIQGYAPVTNLYSSAIAVGWMGVLLFIVLERLVLKNGIGTLLAAAIGFCTLIVAKNLIEFSSAGDTLEPMRAVLNSNFWLTTHVITITIGYGAMYVAGFIGIAYVLWAVLGKGMTPQTANALYAACYGTIGFATILSFIGTMTGGIWADQSWGRFWGWDPKENGALLIVLWCAVLLHARWGGMVRRRGFLALAIFGNIVTAWSWFGTNMLGIGLHTYGFMDGAFLWLAGFAISQLIIMAMAAIPKRFWINGAVA